MVAFIVALVVFLLTVLAIIGVGRKYRESFTIKTFPYFMRFMTALITIPFNTLVSMYIFVALFCLLLYPGYLKVFYYSAISWLVYMIMLQVERYVVGELVPDLWQLKLRKNAVENMDYYEKRLEEFPKESDQYGEAVCALKYLYGFSEMRARKRGEEKLAIDYEVRFLKLVGYEGNLVNVLEELKK